MESHAHAAVIDGPTAHPSIEARVVAADRRRHPRVQMPAERLDLAYAMRTLGTSAPLAVADLVAALSSGAVVTAFAQVILGPAGLTVASSPQLWFVLGVGLVGINAFRGLYPGIGLHGVAELSRSATSVFLVFGLAVVASTAGGANSGQTFSLAMQGVLTAVAAPLLRGGARGLCGRFSWWRHPLLILGGGVSGQELAAYYRARPGLGLTPIVADIWNDGVFQPIEVTSLAHRHHAYCGALPLEPQGGPLERSVVRFCASIFPSLWIIPTPGTLPVLWTEVVELGGDVGVQSGMRILSPRQRALKRSLDLTLAGLMALLALPFGVVIAALIRLTSAGPVFYGQQRVGQGRRVFKAWKFRTMRPDADHVLEACLASSPTMRDEWARTQKLRNDPRVTAVGRVLRKTSLDELPQLWNVIRGEMSLVGPRPIVHAEIPRYGEEFGLYLMTPPGLTGLWQVSGRNRTTYAERIAFDSYYVRNWCIWLDLYILGRTVRAVLTGDGAV